MTGISMISGVQKSMRYANAEIDFRSERRHKEVLRVQQIARITHLAPPPVDPKIDVEPVEDSDLKPEPASPTEGLADHIDSSIFAPLVHQVDPVDKKVEKTLRDLTVVVGDPSLYLSFAMQPQVQALAQEPKLVDLSNDPEIAAAMREHRYRDLLNSPKLAGLLDDHELVDKLKAIKIDELLKQVQTTPIPMGVGHPAFN